jgi:hypothetical protein
MENHRIDFSRFTQVGAYETQEVARQKNPQLQGCVYAEQERQPSYYRVQLEKAGLSEFSGGKWSGRSR